MPTRLGARLRRELELELSQWFERENKSRLSDVGQRPDFTVARSRGAAGSGTIA